LYKFNQLIDSNNALLQGKGLVCMKNKGKYGRAGWLMRTAIAVGIMSVAIVLIIVVNKPDTERRLPSKPIELSAWLVDWQWQPGLMDMKQLGNRLSSLQLFGAYFNETDQLMIRDHDKWQHSLIQLHQGYQQDGAGKLYLTLVNDEIHTKGSVVQKSSELVHRLMENEESRQKHLTEVLNFVDRYGVDGIEMDYEQIDEQDWSQMMLFWESLQYELQQRGKFLRIVLEPRAPIEQLVLPEGPVYVMMAYNLYGMHSGPGPKADHAYIKKLAQRMKQLPGTPVMALALGGFDWADSGKASALTEQQAAELSLQSDEKKRRDADSGGLYFHYTDGDGITHTVWYADEATVTGWMDTAIREGCERIALWRLGGVQSATLTRIRQYSESVLDSP